MIREATTEIRMGMLDPQYLDITFRLAIDLDEVIPLGAEVHRIDHNGKREVVGEISSNDAPYWWDILSAREQDEIVREIEEAEMDPNAEWDFNDNGNGYQRFRKLPF